MEEAWNKKYGRQVQPILDQYSRRENYRVVQQFFSLGSCVLVRNHILLEMSAMKYAVDLPQFCGGHRLSRVKIDWHRWDQSFTQSSEEPSDSCLVCASLYFIRENMLLWTMIFLLQMRLQHLRRRECIPELLSRSENVSRGFH